jgi:hypothetical protein
MPNKLVSPLFIILLGLTLTTTAGCTNHKNNSAVAQNSPKPEPQIIVQPGEIRPLPGKLDNIPVFNSNSPEWIKNEGILLSTSPPVTRKPQARTSISPFREGLMSLLTTILTLPKIYKLYI